MSLLVPILENTLTTANPLPLVYGAAQGTAISGLGCLARDNEIADYSWISSIVANAAVVVTVAYTGAYKQAVSGASRFESTVLHINKLASVLPIVTLLHKLVKTAADSILDYFYTSTIDNDNQSEETVGTTGENNQNNYHEEL
jgi:hypothetical protein